MSRSLAVLLVSALLFAGVAGGIWYQLTPSLPADDDGGDLPLPPFPPRITSGGMYEACLATLASAPASALAAAEAWQAQGGGEGAIHCHGLALIATGKPGAGAEQLEQLAEQDTVPALARALVLGQATQARLMIGAADKAEADATAALTLSPYDADMMIMRASAETMQGRFQAALADLTEALRQDANRADALVARAVLLRRLDRLDQAQADVSDALALEPNNGDALLERGILRQRRGDRAGAQADWEHARGIDPNSATADLAAQNLSLLEAGPDEQ